MMEDCALIIIVTYNSENFIEKCLFSIANQNFKNYFLLVIDNNSGDSTVDRIKQYKNAESRISSTNFKLVQLNKNLGFSGAVDYGVFNYFSKKSRISTDNFKYLILLNPDLIIDEDALINLIYALKTDKEEGCENYIGAAGGLILDYSNGEPSHLGGKIDFNFITSHIKNTDLINLNKIVEKDNNYVTGKSDFIDVDYATGALFATRMFLFLKLGGFDTGYRPAYFEELDYCLKVKRLGFGVVVNPFAFAKHFESASSGKFSDNFYYFYHKNRIRCAIINSNFLNILKIFFKYEIIWLKSKATRNQIPALIKSYLINWLFCPYYLIIKIKNFIIIARLKKIYACRS
ncbi:glycosyltransferase family 2 protein [bacterium]|nr:glycosyltransferase family 2 protein [bacterium]